MDSADTLSTGSTGTSVTVTMKLYASLGSYLPAGAERNMADVGVEPGTTVLQLLDSYNVPREACHLVLLNGIFQPPSTRGSTVLSEGDAVAVWPPVAGG